MTMRWLRQLFAEHERATITIMADPRTDRIAREAARLLESGRSDDMNRAIRCAADALGFHGVPLPGHGRVRKHAQAMSMQSSGGEAYRALRHKVWHVAEQIMSVFEHVMPDSTAALVGRAAQGHVDAGVTIHIRLYTRASVSDIAAALVDYGYDEPSFQTADARCGRLNQICFVEEGLDIVLTRCPPPMAIAVDADLFTGKPIETIDLPTLRRGIDQA